MPSYLQDRCRKDFCRLLNSTIPSYFCFLSWDKNHVCGRVCAIKSSISHLLWKVYELIQKYNFIYFFFGKNTYSDHHTKFHTALFQAIWANHTSDQLFLHTNKQPWKLSYHVHLDFKVQFRISWEISSGMRLDLPIGG